MFLFKIIDIEVIFNVRNLIKIFRVEIVRFVFVKKVW